MTSIVCVVVLWIPWGMVHACYKTQICKSIGTGGINTPLWKTAKTEKLFFSLKVIFHTTQLNSQQIDSNQGTHERSLCSLDAEDISSSFKAKQMFNNSRRMPCNLRHKNSGCFLNHLRPFVCLFLSGENEELG